MVNKDHRIFIKNIETVETVENKYITGLVSIIIPTYNRYELLLHCINSCLSQTYKNLEIIVINDCSTDKRYYSGKLEKLSENIKIIHLPINQKIKYNVSAAQGITRQCGVDISRGEWIAFLDDDDFFLPNKIEVQLNKMINNGYLFSSSNMFFVRHNTITEENLDIEILKLYFDEYCVQKCLNKEIINNVNLINNSSVIIHKTIINIVGDFKPIKYEDWDYWKRSLSYVNCLYIDIPLVYYTHSDTQNNNGDKYKKNYI